MLESISLKNFQCHSSLGIRFDPAITTITGPSDCGKSSALRAIRWIMQNVPGGIDFIAEGESTAIGQLVVDGQVITRTRGKNENSYQLDDEEYRAFGREVPQPIVDLVKVCDTNFQDQHDPVFWFSLSAGEVSRSLNAVVDLGMIDTAMAKISAKVRHYQSVSKVCKDRLAAAKEKKSLLDWVHQADIELRELESLADKRSQQTASLKALQHLVADIEAAAEAGQAAAVVVAELREVGLLGQAAIRQQSQVTALLEIYQDIQKAQEKIKAGNLPIDDLSQIVDRYAKTVSRHLSLGNAVDDIETAGLAVHRAKEKLEKYRRSLSEMGEVVCPTCGNEVTV